MLNQGEVKDMNDVFAIYGNHAAQTIPTNMLGPGLRAMNLNPLEREVIKFVTEFDRGRTGVLTRSQFTQIYMRKREESYGVEQLLEALSYLDKNKTGMISVQEFKYYMCRMGENMNEIDVEDILKISEAEAGKININKFARILNGKKI